MAYNWPESTLLAEFGARRLERLSDGVLMHVVGALILTKQLAWLKQFRRWR
jgi:hypothetical protein